MNNTEAYEAPDPNEIYDTPEFVAKELGLSDGTLANWRTKRKGPPFSKFGGLVRYPRSKRKKWIDKRTYTMSGAEG